MPIVNRLKKLFVLGSNSANDGQKSGSGPGAKSIPNIVRLETDVLEYWTLDEVIGDGAFGSVYKARSKMDPSQVAAAKAMEVEEDEGQDVMVEVSILTQCKHPNIVELYDAFTMGSRITLLLEYCGGGAVDSIMMELSRNLTEQQIHYIMKEILKALDFLHGRNVIHRDLKAGNVLLTSDARVKLADFGVSALCKDAREVRSTFIGTPYWMAPEVMLCETFPEKHYNKLADIWSFGITLIEMAEEKPPYAEMNPAKVIFKVIKADPPTLERPNIWSLNFRDVVAKCLTKDPENRPTAADVLAHPFFASPGSVQCIRSLISEMNAEHVTTEVVMGSDDEALYDEEDDDDTTTASSVTTTSEIRPDDINSISSKQQRHSIVLIPEQKISSQLDPTPSILVSGKTVAVELTPTLELGAADSERNFPINTTAPVFSRKKQRAPSLPESVSVRQGKNTVAIVEINSGGKKGVERANFLEKDGFKSAKAIEASQHSAVEDALSDLDKALSLEEILVHEEEEPSPVSTLSPSPGFLPSDRSDPSKPLQSLPKDVSNTSSKVEKMNSGPAFKHRKGNTTDDGILLQRDKVTGGTVLSFPHVECHNRKPQSHVCGEPTTVHITETGAIVTTAAVLSDYKSAETVVTANFTRANSAQETDYVYALKVVENQQVKVKSHVKGDNATVSIKARKSAYEESHIHGQQQKYLSGIPAKQKDTLAYKSCDSLLKVDNEESMCPTATQRCSSQPQVNSTSGGAIENTRPRHVIRVGDGVGNRVIASMNDSVEKRPLGVSLSTDQVDLRESGKAVQRHLPQSALQDTSGGFNKNYVHCNRKCCCYGKSASEKSSPLMEFKHLQPYSQPVLAEFKIFPPPFAKTKAEIAVLQPGVTKAATSTNVAATATAVTVSEQETKKTVFDIRRPLSYSEISMEKSGTALATQKVTSPVISATSSDASSPALSLRSFSRHSAVVAAQAIENSRQEQIGKNRIVEQDQNCKEQVMEQGQSRFIRGKNITHQKVENKAIQNGAVPFRHQIIPTTSSRRKEQQQDQDYNYFGTGSSSSSNSSKNLRRTSYEFSHLSERDSSSSHTGDDGNAAGTLAAVPESVASLPQSVAVPPPEPPVDYYDCSLSGIGEDRRLSKSQKTTSIVTSSLDDGTSTANSGTSSLFGARRSPHRQTVTKKTRVYVVDGVQMTSTSHQVFGAKQDFELRKQQLHELRRLQREEARQQRELNAKAESLRNEQAKRFASDKENIYKKTDAELQVLARTQKRKLKDCEELESEDIKQALKRIQNDQERELRMFREQLKQEQRDLKMETDAIPKIQRKDAYRMRKEQLDREQQKRELNFIAEQQSEQAAHLAHLQLEHKMKILQLEKNFLQQKHAVLRSREASEWDMEEKQLAERHLLNKQELKDRFYLQRTQMFARHQRELDHMRRVNEMDEEEQVRLYANFKKRLPKDFRTESKTRIAMFKESLRISCQNDGPAMLHEKLRAFEEKEKQRVRNALEEHDNKYSRKLRELKEKNATALRELEEIHSEKRKMLLEAEQTKMEMYEKEYGQVIADWKAGLPIRKQALEAEFARELDEVEAFYRKENLQLQQLSAAVNPIGPLTNSKELAVGATTEAVIGSSGFSGSLY